MTAVVAPDDGRRPWSYSCKECGGVSKTPDRVWFLWETQWQVLCQPCATRAGVRNGSCAKKASAVHRLAAAAAKDAGAEAAAGGE